MKELLIYDIIGEDFFGQGVTARSVKAELDAMRDDEELAVRINSPGGDVFDGFAIFNLLTQRAGDVHVSVDGLAASAASVIAMAGSRVEMAENAMMMIHNPYTFAIGDADEMLKKAELLEKIKGLIITSYQSRVDLDNDTLSALMNDETWFGADEAIESGFADAVAGKAEQKAQNFAMPWFKNAPKITIEQSAPEFRIAARANFPVF